MDFALISEGMLKSDRIFDMANVLSVRLHTLTTGENAIYFDCQNYMTEEEYINRLVMDSRSGQKCQIVNFNINYIDDRLAKCFTKIISRMLFRKASEISPRGSKAFHIVIEEAHRYVQRDKDIEILGYNIFERITKEGRKYGVFLTMITQRPSELSDTCISQCSNFIILRTLHPTDLHYIEQMVPNVSEEVVLQLKNLKPGNCIAFGTAFKVPITMHIDLPNPRPSSNNIDLENIWFNQQPQSMNVNQIMQASNNQVGITAPTSNIPNQTVNQVSSGSNTTQISQNQGNISQNQSSTHGTYLSFNN